MWICSTYFVLGRDNIMWGSCGWLFVCVEMGLGRKEQSMGWKETIFYLSGNLSDTCVQWSHCESKLIRSSTLSPLYTCSAGLYIFGDSSMRAFIVEKLGHGAVFGCDESLEYFLMHCTCLQFVYYLPKLKFTEKKVYKNCMVIWNIRKFYLSGTKSTKNFIVNPHIVLTHWL